MHPYLFCILIICCLACNETPAPNVKTSPPAPTIQEVSPIVDPVNRLDRTVYQSDDMGLTWQNISGHLPNNIDASFMERMGSEILLATDNAGIFISAEERTTWQQIGSELPGKKINALKVVGSRIYVSVFELGLYYTDDIGATWQAITYDLPNLHISAITLQNSTLLVGTDLGIFSLAPDSKNWQPIYEGPQIVNFNQTPDKIVAGTNQGVLLSQDNGDWRWIHREDAAHNTAVFDNKIIVMNISNQVVISDDWGKTWYDGSYHPYMGSYVYEAAAIDNTFIMSNNYGVHRSVTGGASWELVYKMEGGIFFDFLAVGTTIYGGIRQFEPRQ